MSDSIVRFALEAAIAAIAAGGGIGGAAGLARAAWRAGGQFGVDVDLRREALQAQVELEKARASLAASQVALAEASQPRSLHYAPHVTTTTTAPSAAVPGGSGSAFGERIESGELPGIVDLADLGFRPTTQGILLGLAPGGTPITVSARHLMHTGLIGATGGGKSNTGRLILSQLLHCGVECVIADPHFTTYDAENDDDWAPIAQRLKIAPARKAGEIADLFGWLNDELSRRLDLRSAGERVGKPVVAYVDELPAIVADVPGAMDALGKLLREGRKVALYLVSASQDLLVKTLKSGGEIRENLRSCYYSGGALHSAASLLDMSKKDIGTYEHQLGRGIVLLRSHATPQATLARVPLASNEAIRGLLTNDAPTMGRMPDSTQRVANESTASSAPTSHKLTAEQERVLALFKSGRSLAEIVLECRGIRSNQGKRYQQALEEISEALRVAVG